MHKNDNSMKLLVLIIVAIGAIFFVSQWKKIYVYAEDVETVSSTEEENVSCETLEGGSDIMSAPVTSDIVPQITYVQSSSSDYSEQLDEIQNQLTILYNDLHAIALALGVTYSQPVADENDEAEPLLLMSGSSYTIFEIPSGSWGYSSSGNVHAFADYDYILYNGTYFDTTSCTIDGATHFNYYQGGSNKIYFGLRDDSSQLNYTSASSADDLCMNMKTKFNTYTTTDPNATIEPSEPDPAEPDPTPIVSSSSVSNLYTLVLIQTIFVCMFIIFNLAWHTSSKLRDFTKHKF